MGSVTANSVRCLLEATAGSTGAAFFNNLARSTAQVLDTRHGFVGERVPGRDRIRSLAHWNGSRFAESFEYELSGTPCALVMEGNYCQYPDRVAERFPRDVMLSELGIRAYFGVPLRDHLGHTIGILVGFDERACSERADIESTLGVFAVRASTELSRMRDELALRESERRYREIVTTCSEGVWVIDAQGITRFVNEQMGQMLGYGAGEMLGRSVFDFWSEAGRARAALLLERRRQGVRERYEGELLHRDGSTVHTWMNTSPLIDADGAYAGALAMVTDVSEQRELEGRMREVQRLESLGLLAGGIAHDFNNLLVGVLGRSELALARLERGHPVRPMVEAMRDAAERAAELTRQLLAYAGKAPMVLEAIDLQRAVKEIAGLCLSSSPGHVRLELSCGSGAALVRADPGALTQVLLNLITNALQAIGDARGTIGVHTERVVCREGELIGASGERLAAGDYVMMVIRDDGAGMDPQISARAFEPFFSTKRGGRGLGLAAVHGIVRTHGGAISLSSGPSEGTAVTVHLPAAPEREAADEQPKLGRGRGKVLLADDESAVREVVRLALESAELTVDAFGDGRAAVERFSSSPDTYAAVLLDVTMPGLGGLDAAREIRALRPKVPVVFMSGFTDEDIPSDMGDVCFLQKPFRTAQLIEMVTGLVS
jgi:PAS domain S-box-containing protein